VDLPPARSTRCSLASKAEDWELLDEVTNLWGAQSPASLPIGKVPSVNGTADCVVGGFRWHKEGGVVGSFLLGLYDEKMILHYVGVASSFSTSRRRELVKELEPFQDGADKDHPWLTLNYSRESSSRCHEPFERRKGHGLETCAPRTRLRSELRPLTRRALQARNDVSAVEA
jgi:hypothetical protein